MVSIVASEQNFPRRAVSPGGLCLESSGGGEWGIRTPEGLHPTRFPSVRHRPLGEFSGAMRDL